ncbi:MAG: hypothetical protein ACYSUI_13505 [Planctomycetota bacterium]|jgi:hypothetical protein
MTCPDCSKIGALCEHHLRIESTEQRKTVARLTRAYRRLRNYGVAQEEKIEDLTSERDFLLEQSGQATVRAEQAEDRAEKMERERDAARAIIASINDNLAGHERLTYTQMAYKLDILELMTRTDTPQETDHE